MSGNNVKYNNIIYVFMPFRFDDIEDVFNNAKERCSDVEDPIWKNGANDIKSYFFKFLTDKIKEPRGDNPDRRCCIHLAVKEKITDKNKFMLADDWEDTLEKQSEILGLSMSDKFRLNLNRTSSLKVLYPNKDIDLLFHFDSFRLSIFKTGIGIVSLGLVFDSNDPEDWALAENLLKNAYNLHFYKDGTTNYNYMQFITFANTLVNSAKVSSKNDLKFRFFSPHPRANLLSLFIVENAELPDIEKTHYYLGNGYNKGFMYPGAGKTGGCQFFGDPNLRWGVSNEIVSCLVQPNLHPDARDYIYNDFYFKFRHGYLFMYVWLLHQKYALYSFLTDISVKNLASADPDNSEELKNYKQRFAEFEANYDFARIAEVPQYQIPYDTVSRQFALKTMYEDVKEPLKALENLVREEEEHIKEKEQKAATRIATALSFFAILSVFSAYIDSYEFVGKFFGGDGPILGKTIWAIRIILFGVITVGWFCIIHNIYVHKDSKKQGE